MKEYLCYANIPAHHSQGYMNRYLTSHSILTLTLTVINRTTNQCQQAVTIRFCIPVIAEGVDRTTIRATPVMSNPRFHSPALLLRITITSQLTCNRFFTLKKNSENGQPSVRDDRSLSQSARDSACRMSHGDSAHFFYRRG